MTMLPNTNGIDSAQEHYERCVRSYNVAVSRYNSAIGYLESAEHGLSTPRVA